MCIRQVKSLNQKMPAAVISLNSKNFKRNAKGWTVTHPSFKGKQGMIVFKQNWCMHCTKLKPDYLQAAQLTGNAFAMGSVEGTEAGNDAVMKNLNIVSYPTILFVSADGSIGSPYTGDRSPSGLLTGICGHVRGTKGNPSPSFCG